MSQIIKVCDIGSRYGIHPSWQNLTNFEIQFLLVEADSDEAERLKTKYTSPRGKNSFKIFEAFLGAAGEYSEFFQLRNAAMSGTLARLPSRLFSGERKSQTDVSFVKCIKSITLDELFHDESVDFLKLDTEGNELKILEGSQHQLEKNILGIRSEVAFNSVFKGGALFSDIDKYLRSYNFGLLSLDYDGHGDLQHSFADSRGRYGVLNATDAIYIKSEYLSFPFTPPRDIDSLIKLLKVILFVFKNHAPDLGVALLADSTEAINSLSCSAEISELLYPLSIVVERYFYSLKWLPEQSEHAHSELFESIFLRQMRSGTDFMTSLELNP